MEPKGAYHGMTERNPDDAPLLSRAVTAERVCLYGDHEQLERLTYEVGRIADALNAIAVIMDGGAK